MKTLKGHIFLIGRTGSGKTYRMGYFLKQLLSKSDMKIVVYLPLLNTPLSRICGKDIVKINVDKIFNYDENSVKNGLIKFVNSKKKVIIFETENIEDTMDFYRFLSKAIKQIGNLIVFIDEAHYFVPLAIKKDYLHLHLFTQGQNNNVFVIAATQRPSLVNKNAFLNSTIFYIYQLIGIEDLRQLRNCIPSYLIEEIIPKLNKGYCLKVDTSFNSTKLNIQFLKPLP